MKNKRLPFRFATKLLGSVLVLIVCFIIAMMFGAEETTFRNLWLTLTSATKSDNILILREIRLPRELAAMLIGAALAVSGGIIQGITRNPLADPGLLGLTSGANMALALAFVFMPSLGYFGIMVACFVGAALGAVLVIVLGSMRRGSLSPIRVVLAGAAVSAFMYAISDGISMLFQNFQGCIHVDFGRTHRNNLGQIQAIAPVILIGLVIVPFLSNQINILSLSDAVATGLGQKLVLVKTILFLLVIVLTGASVALIGNMAFVGLMIPHIVRKMVGTDYRYIIPVSIFAGASFMLLAETLGRTINAPYETPVVAIASMLGLPFFLFVVRRGGKALS
ncbi:FecCD family ABC transporter permease [Paenibacillus sp. 1A_MP2]|uniref:FecCD family ABC transporter permease n=1 Tax=Paenibacillus sp. 1A_MP2 TaxID=3457495 RepID=UPI003FCE0B2A